MLQFCTCLLLWDPHLFPNKLESWIQNHQEHGPPLHHTGWLFWASQLGQNQKIYPTKRREVYIYVNNRFKSYPTRFSAFRQHWESCLIGSHSRVSVTLQSWDKLRKILIKDLSCLTSQSPASVLSLQFLYRSSSHPNTASVRNLTMRTRSNIFTSNFDWDKFYKLSIVFKFQIQLTFTVELHFVSNCSIFSMRKHLS